MTVAELIEKLQEMPPDAEVHADFGQRDTDASEVRRVREQSRRMIWIEP